MYDNGLGVPRDYTEAVRWYRLAADEGYPVAQYDLGDMYEEGHGVPQDYAEAVRWYRKAADQELPVAQLGLGYMYANGRGVPQDYVLAHMWFNLSAAHGNKYLKSDEPSETNSAGASVARSQLERPHRGNAPGARLHQ
jgi:TPR repeat protein